MAAAVPYYRRAGRHAVARERLREAKMTSWRKRNRLSWTDGKLREFEELAGWDVVRVYWDAIRAGEYHADDLIARQRRWQQVRAEREAHELAERQATPPRAGWWSSLFKG